MTRDRQLLPADADERRRLWRQWIHVDLPVPPSASVHRRVDVQRRDDWLHDALPAQSAVVDGLSKAIREALVGGELPASDRARLLHRAGRLGLNRFEANLLIAAVQHRSRLAAGEITPRFTATIEPEPRRFGIAKLVACAVAFEAIVGAMAVHLLTR